MIKFNFFLTALFNQEKFSLIISLIKTYNKLLLILLAFLNLIYSTSLYAKNTVLNSQDNLFINYKYIQVPLKNSEQKIIQTLKLWVANTPETRSKGLMQIKSLPLQQGMLFIFDEENTHCFWMKNTPINLGIIFLNQQKKIVDIQSMKANTLTHHCALKPSLFAIEVNEKELNILKNKEFIYIGKILDL